MKNKKVMLNELTEIVRRIMKEEYEKSESLFSDAKTIKDVGKIAKQNGLTKAQMTEQAYGNAGKVDIAIPASYWKKINSDELKPYGGTSWFVMDYSDNQAGRLVHLAEKILGKELTNWEEKLEQ